MSEQRQDTPSDLGLPIGVWDAQASGSRLGFAVKTMWGLATVNGHFERFGGQLEVQPDEARGELTIEAASLDTGHTKRDTHLRSADFFDASERPTISFTAAAITPGQRGDLIVTGDLAVGGRDIRLQLPVRVTRGQAGRLHLSTKARLTREQVGMTWNRGGMIRGDILLTVELELTPVASPDDETSNGAAERHAVTAPEAAR